MIRKDLLDEALHSTVTIGMRKTKELLFFAAMETIHTEAYAVAEKAKTFIENDAEYLLQRMPADIKAANYHDDEVCIRQILDASGLVPKGGTELDTATIRGLLLTVSHQDEIGALYPQILGTLVHGVCREFFD